MPDQYKHTMKNLKTKSKNSKLPFKREFSAGGVVFKKLKAKNSKLKTLWLIGKHSGYHKWVLPKGLIEKGERGFETAVRETEEEMGIKGRVLLKKPIHKEQYWFVAKYNNEQETRNREQRTKNKEQKKFIIY